MNTSKYTKTYMENACMELVFCAYSWLEAVEETGDLSEDCNMFVKRCKTMMKEISESKDVSLEDVEKFREDNKKCMEMYTAYADTIRCHEYLVDIRSKSYVDEKILKKQYKALNVVDEINSIVLFVSGKDEDGTGMERLQAILEMLPIKITKNKLFDRINENLTLYKNGEKQALDDFVYRLRSIALLEGEKNDAKLNEILTSLDECNYDFSSESEYNEVLANYEKAAMYVTKQSDFHYYLGEIINKLYAILLLKKYGYEDNVIFSDSMKIINDLANGIFDTTNLVKFEELFEKNIEKKMRLDAELTDYINGTNEKDDAYEDFRKIKFLTSDSFFVDMNKEDAKETVDSKILGEVSAKLEADILQKLSEVSRPVKRAIMTYLLSSLVPDIDNVKDVETLIQDNLFGAGRLDEKLASLENIKGFIETM